MKYRSLGNTGIKVSEIGFGTWAIGGLTPGQTSYGKTNDKVSFDALLTAFDLGINFFDTANVYGNGHSEELLGKAFKKYRTKVIIASKCGLKDYSSQHDFSNKAVRASVESSLARLQTDYLDLLQLHDPPPDIATNEKLIETLSKLRNEGKIRAIGVSVKSPIDGLQFLKNPWQTIQCNLNMIDQRALNCGLLSQAARANIGIITRTPLAFGFLSGNFTGKAVKFEPGDHRSRWPDKQIRIWADAPNYFLELNKNKNRTLVQLAMKFCISFDSIATTIPGITTRDEAIENAFVSDIKLLSKTEINGIMRIGSKHKFFIK